MDLLDSKGLERSRVSILPRSLLASAACHPCLVGGDKVGSSKIDTFLDLVDELITKVTVPWSSRVLLSSLPWREVEDRGYTYQYLDGRTRDRGGKVKAFQNGDDPCFLSRSRPVALV